MTVAIPVEVSDFPPGSPWVSLNGFARQTFSLSAILRAAMVAGYPNLKSIPSRQFARWRTAAFHVALRHSGGNLIQPPEWGQLDPSEKGAIGSLLGVVMTKLLVERLLSAPLFLYLDVFFTVAFPPGVKRIRPDFLAMDAGGGWFAAEAKGKARFRQATLENGKEQANAIGTVNGQPVRACVVCVTSFRAGSLVARFADPPAAPGNGPNIAVEPIEAMRAYYGQLRRFREFSEPVGEVASMENKMGVKLWRSPELDLSFGIVPQLEHALEERSAERVAAVLQHLAKRRDREDTLGPDGIVVVPGRSWV